MPSLPLRCFSHAPSRGLLELLNVFIKIPLLLHRSVSLYAEESVRGFVLFTFVVRVFFCVVVVVVFCFAVSRASSCISEQVLLEDRHQIALEVHVDGSCHL